jgi:AcrR family transcriptional regulator
MIKRIQGRIFALGLKPCPVQNRKKLYYNIDSIRSTFYKLYIDRTVSLVIRGKGMKKKENKNKDFQVNRIKGAALRLFSAKGFHNTTMSEISELADMGKGTIYWYWSSKEELAFSLASDMLTAFLNLVEHAKGDNSPIFSRLKWLSKEVVTLYGREKDYCRLLLKFRADRHYTFSPEYVERVTTSYSRIREGLADIITQGIDSGEIKEVNANFMAYMILGIVEGFEIEWLENEKDFNLQSGFDAVISMMEKSLKIQ